MCEEDKRGGEGRVREEKERVKEEMKDGRRGRAE